jgi:predicted Zn finger-like uncharacterized protein
VSAEANPSAHGIINDMTLATRCSACGTSFRIAQDQLKASGGWVRCGRCNEVFNAIEGLYEIGAPVVEPVNGAGLSAAPEESEAVVQAAAAPLPGTPDSGETLASPVPEAVARILAARTAPLPELPGLESTHSASHEPLEALPPLPEGDFEPAVPPGNADGGAVIENTPPSLHDDELPAVEEPLAVESVRPGDELAPDEVAPSFVRSAQRAERWQRPGRRRVLAFFSSLLLLALGAQATLAYRDMVASRWPALQAPLVQACDVLGCRVEPMRHIAALSVDSSGLQQVGSEPLYNLSVTLRNRGGVELMVPSLDLVLTDSQGRMIARRVLTMAELGRPSRTVAARSEISGQVSLSTGEQRVSGYTIEIFYP